MSDKNKKKNKPYTHPQAKIVENAGQLLKKFIEDIRHDRAFANRIFYPILYQRRVARQQVNREGKVVDNVIETENEFYLLKSEEYSSPGVILIALLLSNGPLVPASKRITLDQFCDKSKEKTILARASAFINVVSNSNLFTFVFGNLSTTPNGSAVGLEEVRQKFLSLAEGHEKIIKNVNIHDNQEISRELKRNQEYLYKMFEHVRDVDIKKTLQFIRYMCDSSNIVSEFAYRPVPNELLTNYLDYDVDKEDYLSLMTLQEKVFTTNNYDKFATEQLGSFTQTYYNTIKSELQRITEPAFRAGLQIYSNSNQYSNAIKTRLKTSLTRIHQITKQYISSALANAIQSDAQQLRMKGNGDIIYTVMALMKDYLRVGDEQTRDQIYNLISNCNLFANSCDQSKQSLCALIYEIIKSDVQYFKGLIASSLKKPQTSEHDPVRKMTMKAEELRSYADQVDQFYSDQSNYRPVVESTIYHILSKYKAANNIINSNSEASEILSNAIRAIIDEYLDPVVTQTNANNLYRKLLANDGSTILGKLWSTLNSMFNNRAEMKRIHNYLNELLQNEICANDDLIKEECKKFSYDVVQYVFAVMKTIVYALTISRIIKQDVASAVERYALDYSTIYNNYSTADTISETIQDLSKVAQIIIESKKIVSDLQTKMVKYITESIPLHEKAASNASKKLLPPAYNTMIESLSNLYVEYNAKNIPELKAALVENRDWDRDLEAKLLQHYCQFYLSPILQELTSIALRESNITSTILENTVISKDLLNLSQILTPNAVSSIVVDANVFNDLVYYTYTFMGDRFISINPGNVDEVVDYLHKIYNIKYFNFFIIGRNDIYLYMNYAGVPIMYRGAQTKLRKSDLEKSYRWLTDAREGLYKNIKLPKKRLNNNR